jgi:hypothetical protein
VVDAASTAAAGPADTLEAVAAIDGPIASRLEGHFGLLPAAAADDVEHLALDPGPAGETTTTTAAATSTAHFAFAAVAALRTAGAAALGIAEPARGVELLVIRAECKLLSAVSTHQSLVCERHLKSLL